MLAQEARWFARQLTGLTVEQMSPICDLGSASEDFRCRQQPWIDQQVFGPLRARGCQISHVDLAPGPGVDLAGDLLDARFIERLRELNFKAVICANLLEHVADPQRVATAITQIVPVGGRLLISCPRRFPYHPDPIDTLLRPDCDELAQLFAGTRLLDGAIISAGTLAGYFARRMAASPGQLVGKLIGASTAAANAANGPAGDGQSTSPWRFVPWLLRRLEVTCIVLEKTASPSPTVHHRQPGAAAGACPT